jgi:hypothetical protein
LNRADMPAATPSRPAWRTTAVVWLRKTHGWVGLWGATLGLLFGISGIWLNHRAVLALQPELERSNWQIALPGPAPADAAAMAAWLQSTLQLGAPATNVHLDKARPVAWAEQGGAGHGAAATADAPVVLMQPEHWTISFAGPKATLQAEYWSGNRSVSVRRTRSGLAAVLMNLHKGVGMPVGWILLVDTLAGSLILLSLSGLALWMLTRRRRAAGLVIFGSALAVTAGLVAAHL